VLSDMTMSEGARSTGNSSIVARSLMPDRHRVPAPVGELSSAGGHHNRLPSWKLNTLKRKIGATAAAALVVAGGIAGYVTDWHFGIGDHRSSSQTDMHHDSAPDDLFHYNTDKAAPLFGGRAEGDFGTAFDLHMNKDNIDAAIDNVMLTVRGNSEIAATHLTFAGYHADPESNGEPV